MFAKLKSIVEGTGDDSEIVSQIAEMVRKEEIEEYKKTIGYVDDAIKRLEIELSNNKADLAGWLAAKESGEGVQPRMIDLRAKPIVIKSIEVQLDGMKNVKIALEEELATFDTEESIH